MTERAATTGSSDWRPIIAGLLNADARRVFAEVEVSSSEAVASARRERALKQLIALGLVELDAAGTPRSVEHALRATLAGVQKARPTGPERFLDAEGRIDRYPTGSADRLALLSLIVTRAVPMDAVLSERELGEALSPFTSDVAGLRRYLVDASLLERTATGSQYMRVGTAEPVDNS